MTARQDITLDAGRDYEINVVLTEADLSTPLNLLDCTLSWGVTETPGLVPMIIKSSDAGGITITDVSGGKATIHVVQDDTELLGGLTAQHEMLLTDALGAEATVFAGLITITQSVLH